MIGGAGAAKPKQMKLANIEEAKPDQDNDDDEYKPKMLNNEDI